MGRGTGADSGVSVPTRSSASHFMRQLAESVPMILELRMLDGSAGACLGTSAVLALVLKENGIETEVVRGEFDGEAHWWLEAEGLRVDATRSQFDAGPIVSPIDDDGPYVELDRFPSAWDEGQAIAEFARMYEAPATGAAVGKEILAELRELGNFAR